MISQNERQLLPPLRRVSMVYALLVIGVGMVVVALIIGLVLSATHADYWATDKATRDAAAAGSALLADLGVFKAVPAWVLPFKFLAVAMLFTAISVALSAIIPRIQVRGAVMAEGLSAILKKQ